MEISVAQKLELLVNLQQIDSQVDEITKVRGDLPMEVQDLEDELAGYDTRVSKFQGEISGIKDENSATKTKIKDSDKLIARYKEQLQNVKNNREYEAIEKEIETLELDIQLYEKKIKESNVKIEAREKEIESVRYIISERTKDLASKKAELEILIKESQSDEQALKVKRDEASGLIDERLLFSYNRLRNNASNGLAVVNVRRGACGGCFNVVPPQRQADIREKKKIIVCEHCGRILADVELLAEVEAPVRGRGAAAAAAAASVAAVAAMAAAAAASATE
jgi:predicted  nucleic acid-binding Zn-ribbon protein